MFFSNYALLEESFTSFSWTREIHFGTTISRQKQQSEKHLKYQTGWLQDRREQDGSWYLNDFSSLSSSSLPSLALLWGLKQTNYCFWHQPREHVLCWESGTPTRYDTATLQPLENSLSRENFIDEGTLGNVHKGEPLNRKVKSFPFLAINENSRACPLFDMCSHYLWQMPGCLFAIDTEDSIRLLLGFVEEWSRSLLGSSSYVYSHSLTIHAIDVRLLGGRFWRGLAVKNYRITLGIAFLLWKLLLHADLKQFNVI